MIELLFVACLGTADCHGVSRLYDAREISLMTCMLGAQSQIAIWQRENPGYTIVRWTCSYRDPGRGSALT